MPSVGRKFLMAGKSGLNLTKAQPLDAFQAAYAPVSSVLSDAISDFGPDAVQTWAKALGQDLFTGSTGRVFPKAMKASPLLRAWIARLSAQGVTLHTRWAWTGWQDDTATFETPDGPQQIKLGWIGLKAPPPLPRPMLDFCGTGRRIWTPTLGNL